MTIHVIGYDVGTTGIKTCLFEVSDTIRLIGSDALSYGLILLENGGTEQDLDQVWQAMCLTTKNVIQSGGISPENIQGISFCSQMQGLVLVDRDGLLVRPAMSYMDQRATAQWERGISKGLRIDGLNIRKLLTSLHYTGVAAASVKDPVWKYNWVKENEPEVYRRIHKWLDVKEYLIFKCTGRFVMTCDSAFGTMLYDIRRGKKRFNKNMCHMLGVDFKHLPDVIGSTEMAGSLTTDGADQLGLFPGTPVFGGGGDASLIGVGAGAAGLGQTHIYSGTSGWVSTVVDRHRVDLSSMIGAVVGADDNSYNYFAELETAGKCLEWVKDHLALDEINIYLQKVCVSDSMESIHKNLYDFMLEEIRDVPAGSNGVIFTPWLHGNRCPFEDANARGIFFNISLENGKRDMIHAVLEGICLHLRWQLEAQGKKVKTSSVIRFVGGGALAPLTCQILADVLNREIETVANPQNVGAYGAAVVAAVGLGIIGKIQDANHLIQANRSYSPNPENRQVYERNYEAFRLLYKKNKSIFHLLNQRTGGSYGTQ